MAVENLLVVCRSHHALVTFRLVSVVPFPMNAPAISIRCFGFPKSPTHWPDSTFVRVFSFDTWWLRFYFVHAVAVGDLRLRGLTVNELNKIGKLVRTFVQSIRITPHLGDLESVSSSSLLSKYSCLATLLYSVPLESPLLSFRFISRDNLRPAFMSCEQVWKNAKKKQINFTHIDISKKIISKAVDISLYSNNEKIFP